MNCPHHPTRPALVYCPECRAAEEKANDPSDATPCSAWTDTPPDSEGLWWLYGDEEFGTMGGNYTGVFPPEEKLNMVEIRKLGSGLSGIANGRMISLTPFNAEKRRPGFVGKWRKVDLPSLPNADVDLPPKKSGDTTKDVTGG